MGKPYRTELERFPETLERAARVDLVPTVALLAALGQGHLLTVGSGGSFSSAVLASQLHEFTFGRPSHPVTPLGAVQRPRTRGTAALLLSARGRNRDIIDSFYWLARSDLERIAVFATAHASPLAVAARKRGQPVADGFLAYKDGFLATNSLLMTAAVLVRGALRISRAVEPDFRELQVPEWYVDAKKRSDIGGRLAADTLILLSGAWGKTAAVDFESKLTEAALANASVTDFRNFAHGRHYWLAARGARTRVVLFVTPEDRRVAERMLSTLPPEALPVVLSTESPGPAGALDLLHQAMHLIQVLADHEDVDPGRPHIPHFGRRLYNSGATRRRRQRADDVWLARKAAAIGVKTPRGLETALAEYSERLSSTTFRAIVCDYDGTLCSGTERFTGMSQDVTRALIDLLERGLHLGVATGRGRSVFRDLKQAIPEHLWSRVLVGMYNGDLCAPLSEPQPPSRVSKPSAALEPAARILRGFAALLGVSLDERQAQLSIVPEEHTDLDRLRNSVTDLISDDLGVRVVASTHSIDVIPAAVTKRNVVGAIRERAGGHSDVLCIGDRGDPGGNDYDLLAVSLGLSVDRVSAALDRCWNLSPPGTRGPAATLTYLSAIRAVDGEFALDVDALRVLP